jgi:cell division protein FtsZ
MDWLTQYWPLVVAGVLALLLLARLALMLPMFRPAPRHSGERTIRVVGVGGAGGNAIDHMIRAKQRGVDYVAVNTDAQVLDDSLAPKHVQIGEQLTQGLGAGGDAEVGRRAAEEDAEEIGRALAGSDLVFIAAGLGGGTGSGAAPVIAAQARAAGALTVGVATKPFSFEGTARRHVAEAAAEELRANVDTLLLIENDRVLDLVAEDTSMLDAFKVVNEVLGQTVRAVVDIMTVPGLINLDFADVRTVMRDGGTALTGIGWAHGADRAVEAARAAVGNPLLDHDIRGARAILLNVAAASGMTMHEVTRAAEEVRSAADPDAVIIFGAIFDDRLRDDLRVTVIATRFADAPVGRAAPPRAARSKAGRHAAGTRAAPAVVDSSGRLDELALPSEGAT